MKKKSKLFLQMMLLSTSFYASAGVGPTVSKTLTLPVLSRAAISADWSSENDLAPSNVMNPSVLIGTLTFTNTSIQSISIQSQDGQDATKEGIISFINQAENTKRFSTNILSDDNSVRITKSTGKTLIESSTNGNLLPTNLGVKFFTVAGNSGVTSGNYQAAVSITTTIK